MKWELKGRLIQIVYQKYHSAYFRDLKKWKEYLVRHGIERKYEDWAGSEEDLVSIECPHNLTQRICDQRQGLRTQIAVGFGRFVVVFTTDLAEKIIVLGQMP